MKSAIITILLLIFFSGGFYLGQKSKEKTIDDLKNQLSLMQKKVISREVEIAKQKEEMQKRLSALKKEWEDKKKEIEKLKEKIDEVFLKFLPVEEKTQVETGKDGQN
ncbi:hypothetical protein J7K25_02300 [bacterium]|nr:hypothetical protein [bacterium]